MRERQAVRNARRAREFEAFVAGAGGRLLRAAVLLTAESPGDHPRARRLLTTALGRTYASWDRLRGEDPYDRARTELAIRFASTAWHGGRHRAYGGPLAHVPPRERLVLVLRLFEGVGEEQVAALLGLPLERIRTMFARATALVLHPPRDVAAPPAVPGTASA